MQVRKSLPLFQDPAETADSLDPKLHFFKNSEIGKLWAAFPWEAIEELGKSLAYSKKGSKPKGRPPRYPFRFKVALMVLKHYLDISDEKLVERLNSDYCLQFFCGCHIDGYQPVSDKALLSRFRAQLSDLRITEPLQKLLAGFWKDYMPDSEVLIMDATCYESNIRYPTDPKLLWEACQWVYGKLFSECKRLKTKRPRNRFAIIAPRYMNYARRRRKTHKETRKIKRKLIRLLGRGIEKMQGLLDANQGLGWSASDYKRLKTINIVHFQQDYMFENGLTKVPNRIVSLDRPWVRPIVRGKENRPVEFGQKAHVLMIGGLCFLEHSSFDAYNECKRLRDSVLLHKILTGKTCLAVSADAIYATNANRRFLTREGIRSGFVNKGRKKDDQAAKSFKSAINKERSTRLEGRFGHHKQAYRLRKVMARTAGGEKLWAFFGIMAANGLKVGRMMHENQQVTIENSMAA